MPPSPSVTPSKVPGNQSSSDSGIIIIVAVVGGLALIATVLALFFILRRNRKSQGATHRGHTRNRSDASDAFLLPSELQKGSMFSSSGGYPALPSATMYKQNDSTDSLVTMRGLYDQYEPLSLSIRRSDLSFPSKPILSIQPHQTSPVHSIDDLSRTSTPKSAESVSLYSQPSATSTRLTLSSFPPVPKHSLPPLPPLADPFSPMHRYTGDADPSAPARSDTRVIGKLLKTRAKQRNERKPTRSISRIERKGSIRPADDSDDTEEDIDDRESALHPIVEVH